MEVCQSYDALDRDDFHSSCLSDDGSDAPLEDCCACQALQLQTGTPARYLTQDVGSACTDTPGFVDVYGDTCNYYSQPHNYPQACQSFGAKGWDGRTPNENCCACRALLPPSPAPTVAPASQLTCADTPGYADIYGDGCEYYAAPENYPQACQAFGDNGEEGLTPNQNCCACKELERPTIPPTAQPTTVCVDTPGFVDVYGYGCIYYATDYPEACQLFGETGEAGETPNENCCPCRGLAPPPPSPQASMQPTPCTDTPGFLDMYGDNCAYYGGEENYPQACEAFGNNGEEGMTPNANCCVCKGLVESVRVERPSQMPSMETMIPTFSPTINPTQPDKPAKPSTSATETDSPTATSTIPNETGAPSDKPSRPPSIDRPEKWWPRKNAESEPMPGEPQYVQCVWGSDYPEEYYTNVKLRELMLFESRDECCAFLGRVDACVPTRRPTVSPTSAASDGSYRGLARVGAMAGLASFILASW
ncbi:hypothetical protein ACHAXT_005102 [Thalassiosira profunda]